MYMCMTIIGLNENAIEDLALVLSNNNIDNHIAILLKIRYTNMSMTYDFKLYMKLITDRKEGVDFEHYRHKRNSKR